MSTRTRVAAVTAAVALALGLGATGAQALTVTPQGGPTCSMSTTKNGAYARVTNQSCWRVQVTVRARDSAGTVQNWNGPVSPHFSERTAGSSMVVGYVGAGSNSSNKWASASF